MLKIFNNWGYNLLAWAEVTKVLGSIEVFRIRSDYYVELITMNNQVYHYGPFETEEEALDCKMRLEEESNESI